MAEEKKKKGLFSKRNLLIGCGGLLGIFIILLAFGAYLNSTPAGKATNTAEAIAQATEEAKPTETPIPTRAPTKNPTPEKCERASQQQFAYIDDGLDENNYIEEAYTVKSKDFEQVYFVSAWIYGPGMEEGEGPGVWAISGDKEDPGIILSVDGFASEFTNYPLGSTTDYNVTMTDHGAEEAKICTEINKE
mgnify:CR=1 FL=1